MSSLENAMIKARGAEKRGDFAEAERVYGDILQKFPGNSRARKGMDLMFRNRALAMMPADAPSQAEIEALTGAYEQGQMTQVVTLAEGLLAHYPRTTIAYILLGAALLRLGQSGRAEAALREAHARGVRHPAICNNLGMALANLGRHEEAIAFYEEAAALDPSNAIARNNLGNLLANRGDLNGAHDAYRKALAINPDYPEALFSLGSLLKRQGRTAEASAVFARARSARPGYAEASSEQGKTEALAGNLDAAIALFDEALASDPGHAGAAAHRLFYQLHMADWSGLGDWPALRDADTAISPWAALAIEDDPQAQLRRSRAWAEKTFGSRRAPLPKPQPATDGRIRLGYFSADFHAHATIYLMAGLLREHDRSRFEIHAYSYGPINDPAVRAQIAACTDSFTDVADMADAEVVAMARGHQLDIAVDLKGYTQGGRTQIFAERLAPVQVAFLGYPGTSGASFIDYAVADRTVVPASEADSFSEALMLLPGSYQCNDDQRVIADSAGTRADHGLPEQGFVFCCFNQSYKIGPREWAIWMRLLGQVEGSVLWLFQSNRWADDALRAEAARHGVAPERLVFAPKAPLADHLARHVHADLFLDTFNYTAHTTASDALWAGLPVVTLAGRQFSARVGASLLNAVDMSDLVTGTAADYEALILALATDPARLAAVRQRLAANRMTTPLFDSAGYTRNLEAAFAEAHRRHQAGEKPGEIALSSATKMPSRERLELHIGHDGYRDAQMAGKRDRNHRLLLRDIAERPDDEYVAYQLGVEAEGRNEFAAACAWYEKALAATPPTASWFHDLLIRTLHSLGQAGRVDDGLALAQAWMEAMHESPDFYFVVGNLALERALLDPADALDHWLPLAVTCWERCLDIGERPELEGSVAGRGSHLARHNLDLVQGQMALMGR